ncbi:uncharacterized protein LOC132201364 isoform X2 [Neocloeon triangulifer]|uniref:uncharacterized protein LOC132201364 isoform X2 n=1 Tax=Neocloeon triangulifer TaxID=2078957 RepID=UPI00286F5769|nr:uncharacterized protein LOC132201364 isoform X2 [Neocloeon triangulifer]
MEEEPQETPSDKNDKSVDNENKEADHSASEDAARALAEAAIGQAQNTKPFHLGSKNIANQTFGSHKNLKLSTFYGRGNKRIFAEVRRNLLSEDFTLCSCPDKLHAISNASCNLNMIIASSNIQPSMQWIYNEMQASPGMAKDEDALGIKTELPNNIYELEECGAESFMYGNMLLVPVPAELVAKKADQLPRSGARRSDSVDSGFTSSKEQDFEMEVVPPPEPTSVKESAALDFRNRDLRREAKQTEPIIPRSVEVFSMHVTESRSVPVRGEQRQEAPSASASRAVNVPSAAQPGIGPRAANSAGSFVDRDPRRRPRGLSLDTAPTVNQPGGFPRSERSEHLNPGVDIPPRANQARDIDGTTVNVLLAVQPLLQDNEHNTSNPLAGQAPDRLLSLETVLTVQEPTDFPPVDPRSYKDAERKPVDLKRFAPYTAENPRLGELRRSVEEPFSSMSPIDEFLQESIAPLPAPPPLPLALQPLLLPSALLPHEHANDDCRICNIRAFSFDTAEIAGADPETSSLVPETTTTTLQKTAGAESNQNETTSASSTNEPGVNPNPLPANGVSSQPTIDVTARPNGSSAQTSTICPRIPCAQAVKFASYRAPPLRKTAPSPVVQKPNFLLKNDGQKKDEKSSEEKKKSSHSSIAKRSGDKPSSTRSRRKEKSGSSGEEKKSSHSSIANSSSSGDKPSSTSSHHKEKSGQSGSSSTRKSSASKSHHSSRHSEKTKKPLDPSSKKNTDQISTAPGGDEEREGQPTRKKPKKSSSSRGESSKDKVAKLPSTDVDVRSSLDVSKSSTKQPDSKEKSKDSEAAAPMQSSANCLPKEQLNSTQASSKPAVEVVTDTHRPKAIQMSLPIQPKISAVYRSDDEREQIRKDLVAQLMVYRKQIDEEEEKEKLIKRQIPLATNQPKSPLSENLKDDVLEKMKHNFKENEVADDVRNNLGGKIGKQNTAWQSELLSPPLCDQLPVAPHLTELIVMPAMGSRSSNRSRGDDSDEDWPRKQSKRLRDISSGSSSDDTYKRRSKRSKNQKMAKGSEKPSTSRGPAKKKSRISSSEDSFSEKELSSDDSDDLFQPKKKIVKPLPKSSDDDNVENIEETDENLASMEEEESNKQICREEEDAPMPSADDVYELSGDEIFDDDCMVVDIVEKAPASINDVYNAIFPMFHFIQASACLDTTAGQAGPSFTGYYTNLPKAPVAEQIEEVETVSIEIQPGLMRIVEVDNDIEVLPTKPKEPAVVVDLADVESQELSGTPEAKISPATLTERLEGGVQLKSTDMQSTPAPPPTVVSPAKEKSISPVARQPASLTPIEAPLLLEHEKSRGEKEARKSQDKQSEKTPEHAEVHRYRHSSKHGKEHSGKSGHDNKDGRAANKKSDDQKSRHKSAEKVPSSKGAETQDEEKRKRDKEKRRQEERAERKKKEAEASEKRRKEEGSVKKGPEVSDRDAEKMSKREKEDDDAARKLRHEVERKRKEEKKRKESTTDRKSKDHINEKTSKESEAARQKREAERKRQALVGGHHTKGTCTMTSESVENFPPITPAIGVQGTNPQAPSTSGTQSNSRAQMATPAPDAGRVALPTSQISVVRPPSAAPNGTPSTIGQQTGRVSAWQKREAERKRPALIGGHHTKGTEASKKPLEQEAGRNKLTEEERAVAARNVREACEKIQKEIEERKVAAKKLEEEAEKKRVAAEEEKKKREAELENERKRKADLEEQKEKETELENERKKQAAAEEQRKKEIELENERKRKADLEEQKEKEAELENERKKQAAAEEQRKKEAELESERKRKADLEEQRIKEAELENERKRLAAEEEAKKKLAEQERKRIQEAAEKKKQQEAAAEEERRRKEEAEKAAEEKKIAAEQKQREAEERERIAELERATLSLVDAVEGQDTNQGPSSAPQSNQAPQTQGQTGAALSATEKYPNVAKLPIHESGFMPEWDPDLIKAAQQSQFSNATRQTSPSSVVDYLELLGKETNIFNMGPLNTSSQREQQKGATHTHTQRVNFKVDVKAETYSRELLTTFKQFVSFEPWLKNSIPKSCAHFDLMVKIVILIRQICEPSDPTLISFLEKMRRCLSPAVYRFLVGIKKHGKQTFSIPGAQQAPANCFFQPSSKSDKMILDETLIKLQDRTIDTVIKDNQLTLILPSISNHYYSVLLAAAVTEYFQSVASRPAAAQVTAPQKPSTSRPLNTSVATDMNTIRQRFACTVTSESVENFPPITPAIGVQGTNPQAPSTSGTQSNSRAQMATPAPDAGRVALPTPQKSVVRPPSAAPNGTPSTIGQQTGRVSALNTSATAVCSSPRVSQPIPSPSTANISPPARTPVSVQGQSFQSSSNFGPAENRRALPTPGQAFSSGRPESARIPPTRTPAPMQSPAPMHTGTNYERQRSEPVQNRIAPPTTLPNPPSAGVGHGHRPVAPMTLGPNAINIRVAPSGGEISNTLNTFYVDPRQSFLVLTPSYQNQSTTAMQPPQACHRPQNLPTPYPLQQHYQIQPPLPPPPQPQPPPPPPTHSQLAAPPMSVPAQEPFVGPIYPLPNHVRPQPYATRPAELSAEEQIEQAVARQQQREWHRRMQNQKQQAQQQNYIPPQQPMQPQTNNEVVNMDIDQDESDNSARIDMMLQNIQMRPATPATTQQMNKRNQIKKCITCHASKVMMNPCRSNCNCGDDFCSKECLDAFPGHASNRQQIFLMYLQQQTKDGPSES